MSSAKSNGADSDAHARARQPWPSVPDDSPEEARWRAHVEVRLDGFDERFDDVIAAISRGGPATKLIQTVLTHPNGKWYAGALLGLVAIVYGASVGFGADGFTIGGGSVPAATQGPAPQAAEPPR